MPPRKPRANQEELIEMVSEKDCIDPLTGRVNGLRQRDHRWIQEVLDNGGGQLQAGKAVLPGRTPAGIRTAVKRWRRDPIVMAVLARKLREHGLIHSSVDVFKDALKANVVVKDSKGMRAMETAVPDHATRLRAAEKVVNLATTIDQDVREAGPAAFLDELPLPVLDWMSRQPDGRLPTDEEYKQIMSEVIDVEAEDPGQGLGAEA